MLRPQMIFPQNFFVDYANRGTMVTSGQEGGPQGNPLGTVQPRPYPSTDAVGNPNSFGMMLLPPGYGVSNWLANLPRNNRQSTDSVLQGATGGLIKNPTAVVSF